MLDHYRLEELADGVFAAVARPDGGGRANSGIVRLGDRTLVFDTGMTPQAGTELREKAERLAPVAWVVNSHFHGDHVRGNQAFGDVEIIATERTKQLIETRAAKSLADHQATDFVSLLADLPEQPARKEDRTYTARVSGLRELARTIADVRLVSPTLGYSDPFELAPWCEVLTLGGGHTASDGILVVADRRVAFVGDLLTVDIHPWLGDGDPDRWIEILTTLEMLDVDVFVPGHGRPARVEDVSAFRTHMQAFIAEPERIESLYPDWDFWDDTADRNRDFLRSRAS